ncbi:MAG: tRNA (adenosine(37)-N6)-threonylcarbamoyltransferase complex ATPase subunit type 1 TsaE [Bacteroidota bacterium]
MKSFHSHSREETIRLGESLAASLKGGDVVALSGELGTGKTHFINGVCRGLAVRGHVASPTFTFINEYPADVFTVVHIDLYRVSSRRELAELGIEEYFSERFICLIEWAERMTEYLPHSYISVKLAYGDEENDRLIIIDEVKRSVHRVDGVAV